MSVKINDATRNRPGGKRLVDAPAVQIDTRKFQAQLKDESAWEKSDRNSITVFKTPGLTMVLCALHKGAEMNDLQVDGLVVLTLKEGSLHINTGNETMLLKDEQCLVFHPEFDHSLLAEEDAVFLMSVIKTGSTLAADDAVI